MKYLFLLKLIAALCLFSFKGTAQSEQEKLDLPGDNLNLYSVLKLFQESETLEGFEKVLNDEASKVNNLDLDGDDNIDYIKIVDNVDGDIHNIALKVAVSKDEDQDVAVFVVQKDKDGQVQVQLIGDEDLYGKDYIIEPNFETVGNSSGVTPNPGYTGNRNPGNGNNIVVQKTTTYEIATWPVVRFIFVPTYVIWRSPWYRGYYPSYWRPWKPFFWHYYYGYHYHWHYHYYGHYRRWHHYRFPGWHDRYYGGGGRSRSIFVQTRYKRGDYRKTYTRPELAKEGSAVFKKDYPKAPSVNNKLPAFDKSGRPVVSKPSVSKPGISKPVTKPITTKPVTKPVTRPVTTKPVTKPVTRPVTTKPSVTKPPAIRPLKPAIKEKVTKEKSGG